MIATDGADYHTVKTNVPITRRKHARTILLVLVIVVRTFYRAAGEAARRLVQRCGPKEERMSVVVLCLVRCGCSSGTGAGWLASVVVVRRGWWSSLLVTCQPVGAAGRPFAPDYANCADACASPSILHVGFRFPTPGLLR